jgi:hypothetical protein
MAADFFIVYFCFRRGSSLEMHCAYCAPALAASLAFVGVVGGSPNLFCVAVLKSSHSLALSKLCMTAQYESGAVRFGCQFPCLLKEGAIRYQPTKASAAAWRGFMDEA